MSGPPDSSQPGPSEELSIPIASPQTAGTAILGLSRGDVIWVYLDGAKGFELNSDGKPSGRPALVIQNNGGNRSRGVTIVALMRDANAYRGYAQQVLVSAADLGKGGKDSVIECGSIVTIDRNSRINKKKGVWKRLDPAIMAKVDRALCRSLGL